MQLDNKQIRAMEKRKEPANNKIKSIQVRGIPKTIKAHQKKQIKNRQGVIDMRRIHKKENATWNWFHEMGWIDSNNLIARMYDGVNNVWKDEPCYIIGAGPPLAGFLKEYGWNFFDDKHTIGINHTIEDYDGFEWFFFLDKRFLTRTTYDLKKYRGRIFAQNNTGLKPSGNVTLFKCVGDRPRPNIEQGLYSSNFSGLAALNLAIISGADPIYLIGFGNGEKASHESYHYKKNYTGEVKKKENFKKFVRVMRYYERFKPFAGRVIHVTSGNDMPTFKKMRMADFKKKHKPVITDIKKVPAIVHFSFSDKIEKHADITRNIINKCYGKHYLYNINNKVIPRADLYITEHFQSTDKAIALFPYKNKTINIVHTVNCIPRGSFKKNIVLTEAWRSQLFKRGVKNVNVIKGGVDLKTYENIIPDYTKKVFGRITRYSPGKIHPEWNRIINEILEKEKDCKCLMYVDKVSAKNRGFLKNNRMIYDESVSINMDKGQYLKNMSIYVHANGTFKETLSHAVIEAMATGLPVIYLGEGTGVLREVTGDAGIPCKTIDDVKNKILVFLKSKELRIEYGRKAKAQAKRWDIKDTIKQFNGVIKECLK